MAEFKRDDGVRREAISFQTKSDVIAQLIQQEVLGGRLAPGARLMQEDIAARFGTSTTPVREALRKLESAGLLTRHPHRGHVVATRSADEINDIWGVRYLIEGWEAELAAPNMTDRIVQELRPLVRRMRDAENDLATYLLLNTRFHDAIYRTAGRPTLFSISKGLRDSISPLLAQYLQAGGNMATLHAEHERIVAACAARDPLALRRATQAHIENARRQVVEYIGRVGKMG